MNIYNKLFILEYVKDPWRSSSIWPMRIWYLNISKKKYNYKHRQFDLTASMELVHAITSLNIGEQIKSIDISFKRWYKYSKLHRLIGPAITEGRYKHYYMNGTVSSSIHP